MAASLKIKDVTDFLESSAPKSYQESYDNSGLITGSPMSDVKGILTTLDCTEEVVDEAIKLKANLVIAHHPILFKGLKKLTGSNYVERVIIKAIRNDVAIYAIHTNLDNVHTGVNKKLAERIGLTNLKILVPKRGTLSKLVTFIPKANVEAVLSALHDAGAGQIGHYKNCSFRVEGTGTFMPDEFANPHVGKSLSQEYVEEMRAELIFPTHDSHKILQALRNSHPYEEIAYYVSPLDNDNQEVGSGMIGDLDPAQEPLDFLRGLKNSMQLEVIRHTKILGTKVQKVAVCGGSGSFLLSHAIQAGAQFFVTADYKYHDFFDADGKITIADIGHYESEVATKELLVEVLMKKFPTFACNFSKTVTNPISYL